MSPSKHGCAPTAPWEGATTCREQWMITDRTASESGGRRDVREDLPNHAAG
jgi:hypothetical protein